MVYLRAPVGLGMAEEGRECAAEQVERENEWPTTLLVSVAALAYVFCGAASALFSALAALFHLSVGPTSAQSDH